MPALSGQLDSELVSYTQQPGIQVVLVPLQGQFISARRRRDIAKCSPCSWGNDPYVHTYCCLEEHRHTARSLESPVVITSLQDSFSIRHKEAISLRQKVNPKTEEPNKVMFGLLVSSTQVLAMLVKHPSKKKNKRKLFFRTKRKSVFI